MGKKVRPKQRSIKVGSSRIRVSFIKGNDGKPHPKLRAKLIPRKELFGFGEFLRNRERQIVFTTGVYDAIHIGHVRYLEVAKSLGDILVVGLNTDESVRQLKGPDRPILDEKKRAEMLSFLSAVDYITLFPELTGAEVIKFLKPHIYLCVEGSWDGNIETKKEVQAMAKCGGEIFYTPRQDPILSTTAIINKIGKQHGEEMLREFQKLVRRRY